MASKGSQGIQGVRREVYRRPGIGCNVEAEYLPKFDLHDQDSYDSSVY